MSLLSSIGCAQRTSLQELAPILTLRARPQAIRSALPVDHLPVAAALAHERAVVAFLDDLASFDHDDLVGVAHGRQAVGNDERGAPLGESGQSVLDGLLCLGIDHAGCSRRTAPVLPAPARTL